MASAFADSYNAFENYPCNLVYKSTYPRALAAFKQRLDDAGSRIFTPEDADIDVKFRDLLPSKGTCNVSSQSLDELTIISIPKDGHQ